MYHNFTSLQFREIIPILDHIQGRSKKYCLSVNDLYLSVLLYNTYSLHGETSLVCYGGYLTYDTPYNANRTEFHISAIGKGVILRTRMEYTPKWGPRITLKVKSPIPIPILFNLKRTQLTSDSYELNRFGPSDIPIPTGALWKTSAPPSIVQTVPKIHSAPLLP